MANSQKLLKQLDSQIEQERSQIEKLQSAADTAQKQSDHYYQTCLKHQTEIGERDSRIADLTTQRKKVQAEIELDETYKKFRNLANQINAKSAELKPLLLEFNQLAERFQVLRTKNAQLKGQATSEYELAGLPLVLHRLGAESFRLTNRECSTKQAGNVSNQYSADEKNALRDGKQIKI